MQGVVIAAVSVGANRQTNYIDWHSLLAFLFLLVVCKLNIEIIIMNSLEQLTFCAPFCFFSLCSHSLPRI